MPGRCSTASTSRATPTATSSRPRRRPPSGGSRGRAATRSRHDVAPAKQYIPPPSASPASPARSAAAAGGANGLAIAAPAILAALGIARRVRAQPAPHARGPSPAARCLAAASFSRHGRTRRLRQWHRTPRGNSPRRERGVRDQWLPGDVARDDRRARGYERAWSAPPLPEQGAPPHRPPRAPSGARRRPRAGTRQRARRARPRRGPQPRRDGTPTAPDWSGCSRSWRRRASTTTTPATTGSSRGIGGRGSSSRNG